MFRRFSCLLLMQNYEIQLLYVYVWKKSWTYIFRLIKLQYKIFFWVIQKVIRFIPLCCLQTNVALLSLQCKCKGECVVWLRIVFSMKHQFDFLLLVYFVFFSLFHVQRIEFAEWLYATRKSILIGSSRVPVRHSWILLIH